jgi:hypothetical protein
MSSALTNFWRRDRRRATIDMGHGRTLSVEDVLDGHFRRMTRDAMTRTVDARTVEIQVDDQLRAAITVLAPDLSPLAHLAEELADAVHDVRPEPRFRADLHRALEQTHRQHAAQRTLGTRTPVAPKASTRPWWGGGLVAVLLTLVLVGLWGLRRYRRRAR